MSIPNGGSGAQLSDRIVETIRQRIVDGVYGWGHAPPMNVFNAGGLPMVPFRTDTWKMKKKPA